MLITPSFASVVAVRLPPTVTVPLSMMPDALPVRRARAPPTVDAAIFSAVVPLSSVAWADVFDECVFKVTAPVSAFAESRVMTPSLAAVVNYEVPETGKTPLFMMLPVTAFTA